MAQAMNSSSTEKGKSESTTSASASSPEKKVKYAWMGIVLAVLLGFAFVALFAKVFYDLTKIQARPMWGDYFKISTTTIDYDEYQKTLLVPGTKITPETAPEPVVSRPVGLEESANAPYVPTPGYGGEEDLTYLPSYVIKSEYMKARDAYLADLTRYNMMVLAYHGGVSILLLVLSVLFHSSIGKKKAMAVLTLPFFWASIAMFVFTIGESLFRLVQAFKGSAVYIILGVMILAIIAVIWFIQYRHGRKAAEA